MIPVHLKRPGTLCVCFRGLVTFWFSALLVLFRNFFNRFQWVFFSYLVPDAVLFQVAFNFFVHYSSTLKGDISASSILGFRLSFKL